MEKLNNFYINRLKEHQKKLNQISKRINLIRLLRFIVFLGVAIAVYLTFHYAYIPFVVGSIGGILFSLLVVKHQGFKEKRKLIKIKCAFNENEISMLNGNFNNKPDGKEFINPHHHYSNDIDLFGKGSFFQYLNRTKTMRGKRTLASILTKNNVDAIEEKQKALQELSRKTQWREHFSALAQSISPNHKKALTISTWLKNFEAKLSGFPVVFPKIFSGISLVLIGLVSFGLISFTLITIWFFIGLSISAIYFNKTQYTYNSISNLRDVFKQYYLLLEQIEIENFTSTFLNRKKSEIKKKEKKASIIFKAFSNILDAFDQRNNLIIGVVGNGLFLWDIHIALKAEKWIKTYQSVVENWFHVVDFFDAYNSLAVFTFNHPNYVFPAIQKESQTIKALDLGHPLLKASNRVANNFTIDNGEFFIITGANMAGKSTFLRTVSLAIIMANCGLPVCASSFEYTPIKLITSMRTSDSLTNDESYFYSELKRLKFIVNEISNATYFIILDEILKGTNSKDKAIGSNQFVEKLTTSKSTGIIATHDISLCALADEYSQIQNYYFDAEIVTDELFFDYTMKKGVCKNMNASFLLKKMGIV